MLTGFLCSDTKKLEEDLRKVSFEACLKCAETTQNGCNFTAPFIKKFTEMEERSNISVTSVLGCLRNTYLMRTEEYWADPTNLYWLYRGQLAHKVLEDNPEKDSICEVSFSRELGGIEVTGRPDLIIPAKALVRDYKTTKSVPGYRQEKPYSNHIQQLNTYRWIIAGQTIIADDGEKHLLPYTGMINGKEQAIPVIPEIKRMQVIYMDMANVKTCDSPVYDYKRVEEFLSARLPVLKNAMDNKVLPPKEDSWLCNGYCSVKNYCQKYYEEEMRAEWAKS